MLGFQVCVTVVGPIFLVFWGRVLTGFYYVARTALELYRSCCICLPTVWSCRPAMTAFKIQNRRGTFWQYEVTFTHSFLRVWLELRIRGVSWRTERIQLWLWVCVSPPVRAVVEQTLRIVVDFFLCVCLPVCECGCIHAVIHNWELANPWSGSEVHLSAQQVFPGVCQEDSLRAHLIWGMLLWKAPFQVSYLFRSCRWKGLGTTA